MSIRDLEQGTRSSSTSTASMRATDTIVVTTIGSSDMDYCKSSSVALFRLTPGKVGVEHSGRGDRMMLMRVASTVI